MMMDVGGGVLDVIGTSRTQHPTSNKNPYFHTMQNKRTMSFKFEKLNIWQKAMDFGEEINELSLTFPKREIYNLSSQILRAVDSVALNISEGSILQSNAEFNRFLGYAVRSLAEVVTCLHKAKRRNYMSVEDFTEHYEKAYHLMNMIIAFKSKLK